MRKAYTASGISKLVEQRFRAYRQGEPTQTNREYQGPLRTSRGLLGTTAACKALLRYPGSFGMSLLEHLLPMFILVLDINPTDPPGLA